MNRGGITNKVYQAEFVQINNGRMEDENSYESGSELLDTANNLSLSVGSKVGDFRPGNLCNSLLI